MNNISETMADELVITREVNAPLHLVYSVWTEAEHLAHWWGPKGFTINVAKFEFRPDGEFLYGMSAPDGTEIWGKFLYKEIDAPNRLVFINSFSDKNGRIIRNPWMATWPLEVLNVLTFVEQDGKTIINLRGGPINANAEERETFIAGKSSMQQGFAGTFEQLDLYLKEIL
jgi:uncharacterized protein YndB with AHSA1/START domain